MRAMSGASADVAGRSTKDHEGSEYVGLSVDICNAGLEFFNTHMRDVPGRRISLSRCNIRFVHAFEVIVCLTGGYPSRFRIGLSIFRRSEHGEAYTGIRWSAIGSSSTSGGSAAHQQLNPATVF
jgi:hypothetical protein